MPDDGVARVQRDVTTDRGGDGIGVTGIERGDACFENRKVGGAQGYPCGGHRGDGVGLGLRGGADAGVGGQWRLQRRDQFELARHVRRR